MIRKRTRSADEIIESRVVLVGTHRDKICGSIAPMNVELHRAQNALLTAIDSAFDCDVSEVVSSGMVFAVSSYTLDGIDILAQKMQHLLTDPNGITLVGKVMPESYFQLTAIVHELAKTKPIIMRDELREQCSLSRTTAVGSSSDDPSAAVEASPSLFQDDASFDAALLYLHHSGTALCFEQVAREYIFIQHAWLTKLFSMIELQKHKGKGTLDRVSPGSYRMLTRQGLLRLDLLRVLWKHDKDQVDPARTLSKVDEEHLKKIELNVLVKLMCHFDVMREVNWSKSAFVPANAVS